MSYNPTIWTDHVLSDQTYTLKQNSNGTYDIKAAGKVISKGTPMSADNFNHMEQGITSADKNASDALARCEAVLTSSKEYSDEKIAELIGGAPETLDTLKELADAYADTNHLFAALQNVMLKKVVVHSPKLEPVDGVCTWMVEHRIPCDSGSGLIIQIYDSANNQVACSVMNVVPGNLSVVKISSVSTISANAFYAVCIG